MSSLIGKKITDWALGELFTARLPPIVNMTMNTWEYTKGVADLSSWGVGASYNVALHCVGRKIELVPATAKRAAGETQLYNLQVKNSAGRVIGAVQPDRMQIETGKCTWGSPDWACYGEKVGQDRVRAGFGQLPDATGFLTVTPGSLHSLSLSPRSSEVGVDELTGQLSVVGKDFFGNEVPTSIGPGNSEAHLDIAPEGHCSDSLRNCSAHQAGPHAVTVSQGKVSDVVELRVRADSLRLTPASATISSGGSQTYAVEEVSGGGKVLRSVPIGVGPGDAKLSVTPSGSCNQAASCTAYSHGAHTVTAEAGAASGTALLEVERDGHEQCLGTGGGEGGGAEGSALGAGTERAVSSAASGSGWSAPFALSLGFETVGLPQVSENAAGDGVVVWNGSGSVTAATRSAGGPWSVLRLGSALNGDGSQPQVAMNRAGDWTAAWGYIPLSGYSGIRAIRCVSGNLGAAAAIAQPHLSGDPYDALSSFEPSVAMGGDGSADVAWYTMSDTFSEGLGKAATEAANSSPGGSWSSPRALAETVSLGGPPTIAANQRGDATAMWPESIGYCSVMRAASRAAGSGWSSAATVASPPADECLESSHTDFYEPRLAMGELGHDAAVWLFEAGQEQGVMAALGGGVSWGTPAVLESKTGPLFSVPDVAANSTREDSIAVWLLGGTVRAASSEGGSAWSAPVTLGGAEAAPQVAIDDAGDAAVVWATASGEVQAVYRRAGGAWGPVATLASGADPGLGTPQVAIDADGDAVVVWATTDEQIHAAEFDAGL